MTNEEIATKVEGLWACPDSAIARQSAYMAAKIKDQQFKEYLEKKMVELSSRRAEVGVVSVTCQRFIMEIIKELFGEKQIDNSEKEE